MIGILVSGRYDFPLEIDIALDNVGVPARGFFLPSASWTC